MNIENFDIYNQTIDVLLAEIKKRASFFPSITNEKEYLLADQDSEIMQIIFLYQAIIKIEVLKNKERYEEQIQLYHQFIKFVAEIVAEIALNKNSISISRVVSRLIHEGYLSKNNRFVHTKGRVLDILGYNGINVINGYGCCRHVAVIHQDIFHALELENEQLICYMAKLLDPCVSFQKEGNHVINLVKYRDVYYGHDVYNQCFLKFNNGLVLEKIGEQDQYFPCRYYRKPSEDMIFANLTRKSMYQKILEFDEDAKNIHLSYKKIKQIMTATDTRFNSSVSLLKELKSEREKILNKTLF